MTSCSHEGRTNFAVSRHSPYQHEYCARCGWHKYKGKEYTKEEWSAAYVDDPKQEGR